MILFSGVMTPEMDSFTRQGYDVTFGTNVLGHYYFTKLLLPLLESTAASVPAPQPHSVRIVTLSADGHLINALPGLIDYAVLKAGPYREAMGQFGTPLYYMSKSACILMANAWARDLKARNVDVISLSVHPGWFFLFAV